jgi:GNAT superfamily N-acetyltransferase
VVGVASLKGDVLAHLYVDPEHHNGGVGTALLEQVKARRPQGFRLWTFQANAGARRFYECHGCVPVEFTDGSRNEEKLPDVLYAWPG